MKELIANKRERIEILQHLLKHLTINKEKDNA